MKFCVTSSTYNLDSMLDASCSMLDAGAENVSFQAGVSRDDREVGEGSSERAILNSVFGVPPSGGGQIPRSGGATLNFKCETLNSPPPPSALRPNLIRNSRNQEQGKGLPIPEFMISCSAFVGIGAIRVSHSALRNPRKLAMALAVRAAKIFVFFKPFIRDKPRQTATSRDKAKRGVERSLR